MMGLSGKKEKEPGCQQQQQPEVGPAPLHPTAELTARDYHHSLLIAYIQLTYTGNLPGQVDGP
jgi:hypothetical protein